MTGVNDSRRLSIALIVRDAATALQETLSSVQEIADELVVLDTGSTDASCDVAEKFGAKLIRYEWQDDFSDARNTCQQQVTGDWVLWLDAGERLSADDASALRDFVKQEADPQTAYAILVHVPPEGPGAAGEQVARIRLFPNSPQISFNGRVRETVADSLAASGLSVDALPYRVRRGSREHEPQAKTARARRNIRLCEMEIRQRGATAQLLNCLGDAFQTLNDNERARECFRHALSASARGSVEMLEAYYGSVTSWDGDEKNRETQLSLCVEALEVFPLDAQLLCAMGGYLHAQGRPDLALKAYQTAYKFGQVNPTIWHVDEIREIAAICYSIALQLDNRADEAQALLEDACQSSPSCLRLRRHLLDFFVKRGDRDRALQQVNQLPKETPNREALRSAVRGACLAAQQNWIAAKAYLKTAHSAGCRDLLCLRWLATTYLVGGQSAEARPIVEQWLDADPGNPDATRYRQAIEDVHAPQAGDRHLRIDEANRQGIGPPASTDRRQSAGSALRSE